MEGSRINIKYFLGAWKCLYASGEELKILPALKGLWG